MWSWYRNVMDGLGADCAPKRWTVLLFSTVCFARLCFKVPHEWWIVAVCCLVLIDICLLSWNTSLYHLHISSHCLRLCLSGTKGRIFYEQKIYFWIFIWTEKRDWLCFCWYTLHCQDYCLLTVEMYYLSFNLKYFAICVQSSFHGLGQWLTAHVLQDCCCWLEAKIKCGHCCLICVPVYYLVILRPIIFWQ